MPKLSKIWYRTLHLKTLEQRVCQGRTLKRIQIGPSGATYSANFRYRHKALPENIQQGRKSSRGQTL
jgi:hypothetical protein